MGHRGTQGEGRENEQTSRTPVSTCTFIFIFCRGLGLKIGWSADNSRHRSFWGIEMCQLLDVALAIRTFKDTDDVTLFKGKVNISSVQFEVISNVSSLCDDRLGHPQFPDDGRFSFQAICDYFGGADTWEK